MSLQGGARGGRAARRPTSSAAVRIDVRKLIGDLREKPRRADDAAHHCFAVGLTDGSVIVAEMLLTIDGGAMSLAHGDEVDRFALLARPCHFGGRQWTARCQGCARTCAVLFGPRFGCIRCTNLAHETSQLSKADRWSAKVARLSARLYVSRCESGPWRPPRYMHAETYERLVGELREAQRREVMALRRSVAGFAAVSYGLGRGR